LTHTLQGMQRYLTTSQKELLTPYLLKRDAPTCFYCKKPFDGLSKELKRTFDHLDNNAKNNERENLVLCHWKCNQLKKSYPEFQLMAQNKIHENRVSFDSLDESEATAPKPASKEIDLNVALKRLTYEYLNERLLAHDKPALNYNDTAHSISYIFWQRTGHGSSETVKRHLNDFCSSAAPFKAVEENGETVIIKRI
jgi:hypothetical protein